MRYTITRDGEPMPMVRSVESTTEALPDALLAIARHHGNGEYVASDDEGPALRLALEWLEGEC